MALNQSQKTKITKLLEDKIGKKLKNYGRETSYMPFLSKLIQDDEKVASYSFIHSIATTLGMSIYEEVSKIIVEDFSEEAATKIKIGGGISPDQTRVIAEIIEALKNESKKVNKEDEIKLVLSASKNGATFKKEGNTVDFYFKRKNIEYFIEIKTVKPNIDVFTSTKKKLLEWIVRKGTKVETICAFPYNPYYPEPYTRFTEQGLLEKGRELLVAEEYWDFLGGKDTYKGLLEIFDEVGKKFKSEILSKMKEVARIRYKD